MIVLSILINAWGKTKTSKPFEGFGRSFLAKWRPSLLLWEFASVVKAASASYGFFLSSTHRISQEFHLYLQRFFCRSSREFHVEQSNKVPGFRDGLAVRVGENSGSLNISVVLSTESKLRANYTRAIYLGNFTWSWEIKKKIDCGRPFLHAFVSFPLYVYVCVCWISLNNSNDEGPSLHRRSFCASN